ncbi:MAG: dihydrolipoamide dehydrogenase [Gemmatimonadales bacterium]|jgi:dihydrolipoamide dehydrogenase|nr:dihydrolipoamide dehydrogenase [Gemmatimonadales bacterium]
MASYDVIFVGGGPAGYVGAIRCAQLGMSVAVVEREGLGGTCVLWGCIPAKALLEAASLATKVSHSADFGVTVSEVKLDYGVAMKRSRAVSTQNSKGVEFLFKKNKITWIKGTAKITGKSSVSVKVDGKEEKHEAKKAIVISTGSRVKGLPQIGLELNKMTVLSSDEVLVLEKAPKTMVVVGAGAVGCEFADVFAAFGTQITLIEALPVILPLEDADVSAELTKSFKKRKIDVLTGAKISDVKVGKNSVSMSVESGGKKQTLEVEKVLVAAGRAPNTEDIGLKEMGVQVTDRGFIKINERMETSVKGIYSIGDVAGPPMLAHKGQREGVVFAEFLAGQKNVHQVNYGNIPNATYCHPEVASIGMTEAQVKEKKIDYKVGKFLFSNSGRARTSGETEGFVKIIRDAKYGEILGAHIIGAHATELIHELAVARENEFTVEEVDLAIHAHPTLSEAIAQAALDSLGKMTDA